MDCGKLIIGPHPFNVQLGHNKIIMIFMALRYWIYCTPSLMALSYQGRIQGGGGYGPQMILRSPAHLVLKYEDRPVFLTWPWKDSSN